MARYKAYCRNTISTRINSALSEEAPSTMLDTFEREVQRMTAQQKMSADDATKVLLG